MHSFGIGKLEIEFAKLLFPHLNGQVAQSVERSPEKAGVGGSIPSLATILRAFRRTDLGSV